MSLLACWVIWSGRCSRLGGVKGFSGTWQGLCSTDFASLHVKSQPPTLNVIPKAFGSPSCGSYVGPDAHSRPAIVSFKPSQQWTCTCWCRLYGLVFACLHGPHSSKACGRPDVWCSDLYFVGCRSAVTMTALREG